MNAQTPSTRVGVAVLDMTNPHWAKLVQRIQELEADREALDEHHGIMERALRRVLADCSYTIGPVNASELHEVITRLYALRAGLAVRA